MSPRRLAATFGAEFGHSFRRPLFLMLALVIAVIAFGLSSGQMQISSGDTGVGGTKAWITSEFAQTQTMTYVTLLFYAFFIAAGAGLTLLRDRESKVDVLLQATPLTAGEYVWGRYLAVTAGFIVMMGWQVAASAFFNHVVPNAGAVEIRGPFTLRNYLLPVLTMGVPFLIFYAGLSMLLGVRTGSAVLVFVAPVATLLVCAFFLWQWSPSWLGHRVNQLLQVLDPSGFRWLNETYLKVDRGVAYYNARSVSYDGLFWLNRAWIVLAGLAAVLLTQRSVAGRGERAQRLAALDDGGVIHLVQLAQRVAHKRRALLDVDVLHAHHARGAEAEAHGQLKRGKEGFVLALRVRDQIGVEDLRCLAERGQHRGHHGLPAGLQRGDGPAERFEAGLQRRVLVEQPLDGVGGHVRFHDGRASGRMAAPDRPGPARGIQQPPPEHRAEPPAPL